MAKIDEKLGFNIGKENLPLSGYYIPDGVSLFRYADFDGDAFPDEAYILNPDCGMEKAECLLPLQDDSELKLSAYQEMGEKFTVEKRKSRPFRFVPVSSLKFRFVDDGVYLAREDARAQQRSLNEIDGKTSEIEKLSAVESALGSFGLGLAIFASHIFFPKAAAIIDIAAVTAMVGGSGYAVYSSADTARRFLNGEISPMEASLKWGAIRGGAVGSIVGFGLAPKAPNSIFGGARLKLGNEETPNVNWAANAVVHSGAKGSPLKSPLKPVHSHRAFRNDVPYYGSAAAPKIEVVSVPQPGHLHAVSLGEAAPQVSEALLIRPQPVELPVPLSVVSPVLLETLFGDPIPEKKIDESVIIYEAERLLKILNLPGYLIHTLISNLIFALQKAGYQIRMSGSQTPTAENGHIQATAGGGPSGVKPAAEGGASTSDLEEDIHRIARQIASGADVIDVFGESVPFWLVDYRRLNSLLREAGSGRRIWATASNIVFGEIDSEFIDDERETYFFGENIELSTLKEGTFGAADDVWNTAAVFHAPIRGLLEDFTRKIALEDVLKRDGIKSTHLELIRRVFGEYGIGPSGDFERLIADIDVIEDIHERSHLDRASDMMYALKHEIPNPAVYYIDEILSDLDAIEHLLATGNPAENDRIMLYMLVDNLENVAAYSPRGVIKMEATRHYVIAAMLIRYFSDISYHDDFIAEIGLMRERLESLLDPARRAIEGTMAQIASAAGKIGEVEREFNPRKKWVLCLKVLERGEPDLWLNFLGALPTVGDVFDLAPPIALRMMQVGDEAGFMLANPEPMPELLSEAFPIAPAAFLRNFRGTVSR